MTEHAAPPMPQPTAAHKLLQSYTGNWKVACKFYMDPSQPPMETQAKEVVESVGEFWTVSKYETDFGGMPFVGRCTLGYEPHSGEYVCTWVDSMNPVLCVMRGHEKAGTLTLEGEFFSCMTNSVLRHRSVTKFLGKNEHVFEMFAFMPDGTEVKMMTSHYRRA